MFNRLSLWLLSVCCLAPVTTEAFAQKGGGGTTPPLPNVRYTVQIMGSSPFVQVNKINNLGMIVGHFANDAFIYNQPSGRLYKLNEEQSLLTHLNTIFGPVGSVGSDWIFVSVGDINAKGQVVGSVRNRVTQRTEGFAMNTLSNPDSSTWVVKRLPDVLSSTSYGRRINSHGKVLCYYVPVGSTVYDCYTCSPFTDPTAIQLFGLTVNTIDLNNNGTGTGTVALDGTVAGVLTSGLIFYGTDPTNIKTVNGITNTIRFDGFNDLGFMSVAGHVRINNKSYPSSLIRASVLGNFEKILDDGRPYGLNQDSDIAIQTFNANHTFKQSKLAYNGSILIPKQVLSITDLIPDPEMKSMLVNNEFLVSAIGDRSLPTDFGQLAGRVRTANGFIGVVLTPYVPVP